MKNSRRNFLKLSGIASVGFLGLQQFVSGLSLAGHQAYEDPEMGYGPLRRDPARLLNLPKGFSYKIISRKGKPMSDGLLVPGRGDGMATFAGPDGKIILIRNHENGATELEEGAFGQKNELLHKMAAENFYDFGKGRMPGLGGTTTLVFDTRTQTVEKEFLSLAGTFRNCAGGKTPWNSWITCEENVERVNGTVEKDHGYTFEVPASSEIALAKPVPLKEMGRFNHEAVAVDPRTGIVYQTEDRPDGLIYRFLPKEAGQLVKGGRLQVLALRAQKSFDTRNWKMLQTEKMPLKLPMEVEWLDINQVESPEDDLRFRGFEKGAARFARGEGMWFGNNECYFACTNGGHISKGQVFRYTPSPYEGMPHEKDVPGQLELFLEPNNTQLVKSCDNLTVAPWGDVVLCEDDPHPFIVGVTPAGDLYRLAENVGFNSEFAGGVFSPSGDTFFVNIQVPGITLAITGPWKV